MKRELTVIQAQKRVEQTEAKHDRITEIRKRVFNKFINTQGEKQHDRMEKKLKRLTNQQENAWYAYITAMKALKATW